MPLVGWLAGMGSSMAGMLDARMAFRLSIMMAGMLLADDRRVAASWFAAAGVGDDWDRFYDCLRSVGRNTASLGLSLTLAVVRKFDPGPEGHIVLDFLTSSYAWFMTTNIEGLILMQRIAYESDLWVDNVTDNLLVKGYERYSVGYNDPRAIWAQTPTS